MVIPEFFYEDLIFERINRIEKLDNFFKNLVLQEVKSKGTVHNISGSEISDKLLKKLTLKDFIRHRKDLDEFLGEIVVYGTMYYDSIQQFFEMEFEGAVWKFLEKELKI